MIVVKLTDGSLWINSPVEAAHEDMLRVARLGQIRDLVAPSPLHEWRLHSWAHAFPEARRNFELLQTRGFDNGIVHVHYRIRGGTR
ncbi:MAG TPA: hypothetical protein VKT72_14600 [Candidatus Baltobacteraceae bacterium]|nr:hypothetical protein [Candidatus Baltobacteraceae bacterium]